MSTANDPVVIVSAARTPMGGFQGDFSSLTAAQLGSVAIKAAVQCAGISAEAVEEVIFGCVLPAGQGQAPARQAALGAGLSLSAGCTTINKMCGSGMKATMLAHDLLLAGTNEVMVAGGMESMTNAPYVLPKARGGYRLGHGQIFDHMFLDGLEDAYEKGRLMGTFAEDCAGLYQFTREQQDAYAVASLTRAQAAIRDGVPDEWVRRVRHCAESGQPQPEVTVHSLGFESESYQTVSGQNANNSVRTSGRFLEAVEKGEAWPLYWRTELERAQEEGREPVPRASIPASVRSIRLR